MRDIGSATKRYSAMYALNFIAFNDFSLPSAQFTKNGISPSGYGTYGGCIYAVEGASTPIGIMTDSGNGGGVASKIGIETGNALAAVATFATGAILMRTGNNTGTAATAHSGDITIITGTTVGGVRGKMLVNAAALQLATVSAPSNPINGDIYFDGTNIRMYVAGVWKIFTLT